MDGGGIEAAVEEAGFSVRRVHRQGGSIAAAYILAIYPIGGIAARGREPIRTLARLTLAVLNPIVELLDRVADRILPRHYASPSFLVVASRVEHVVGSPPE